MKFTNDLDNLLKTLKLGNRSKVKQYIVMMQEQEKTYEVASFAIEIVVYSLNSGKSLTNILRTLGDRVTDLLNIDRLETDSSIILGSSIVNLMIELELVKHQKRPIKELGGQLQWFLTTVDSDFHNYVLENQIESLKPTEGFIPWTHPTMHINNRKIDIVKKARAAKMLHHYRENKIPTVYNALNKLGKTEWIINPQMLSFLDQQPSENNLITKPITDAEYKCALSTINRNERTALWIEEVKFLELEKKGFEKNTAQSLAKKKAEDYMRKNSKPAKKILSKWSKRRDYHHCVKLANKYIDDTLNFLYSCDTRGRVYAFNSNLLNPQGSDHAKALLMFKNPKPVSTYDLMVTIANHAGQDKASYDDRIQWVLNNKNNILEVGANPWSEVSMAFLKESKIEKEKKSKFQFIASAIEYVKLCDWIADGNNQDDFLCSIPIAYDATNSGLQILSAIGRDDEVAPHVNITKTEKPGDIYRVVGKSTASLLFNKEYVEQFNNAKQKNTYKYLSQAAETLESLDPDNSAWRSICKRNVMTKNYAATRFGMGNQQYEDQPESEDDKTGCWHKLSFEECIALGGLVYDTCIKELKKAHELMETMQTAVSYNKNAIVSWKLPNGFIAFQYKDKSTVNQVKIKLGTDTLQLAYFVPTGKANVVKHKLAIAPDVVHSLDASLLVDIVNRLPNDANLAFVHDQFGSDSCYGNDIQDIAKEAYFNISSREMFKVLLKQISDGTDISLPTPGTWKPEELFEADYLVC